MRVLKGVLLLFVAVTMAAVPAAADDNDPNLGAIEARRALMKLYSWYAGPLFGMAKGNVEYNAEAASTSAKNLEMVINADAGTMWPKGSHKAAYPGKTRALEDAWTKYDAKYSKAASEAAAAMASAAGNGLDALKANIGALGEACSGCHKAYRAQRLLMA